MCYKEKLELILLGMSNETYDKPKVACRLPDYGSAYHHGKRLRYFQPSEFK
jgi:hypothetical protein